MYKKILFALSLLAPLPALAHEVYVLPLDVVRAAMENPSPDPFSAFIGNEMTFFFWALIGAITVSTIAAATIFGMFQKHAMQMLMRAKRFALPIARITAGISTISFGLMGGLYGTEIPFDSLFGSASGVMQLVFIGVGILLTLGIYVRPLALFLGLIYAYAACIYGWYIFTYTDHIGLFILLFLLGGGQWSLARTLQINEINMPRFLERLRPLAFPILRILFGFGILFASVYAKYLYSQLALEVVLRYDLTRFFPFDPLFVVLGALIIEFLAGCLFMLGIAVRWTSLFLLFWLSLSLLYFQEAVWPHIILFGLCGVIFLHGYDRFSLEGRFMKHGHKEPVL